MEVEVSRQQVLVGALAAVMNDPRFRCIAHLPAGTMQAQCRVKLLEIHEEAGIETAYLGKGGAPDQPASALRPIYGARQRV